MAEPSCGNCWWREGDRCYQGNPEREPDGRSMKLATAVCAHHDPRTLRVRVAEALGRSAAPPEEPDGTSMPCEVCMAPARLHTQDGSFCGDECAAVARAKREPDGTEGEHDG